MNTINWNKYADKYYVISHTINFDKRKVLEKQFIDINLKCFEYRYSINSKLLKNSKYCIEDKNRYVTYTHYCAIKEAYELGYESIIIMEDNIRFLKDINEIKKILDNNYLNGDIVLFDYIILNDNQYCLSDFYRLNRNGMKYLIDNIEDHFYTIDQYFTTKYTYYIGYYENNYEDICCPYNNVSNIIPIINISDKRICIQVDTTNINVPSNMYYNFGEYWNIKIDINEYNI